MMITEIDKMGNDREEAESAKAREQDALIELRDAKAKIAILEAKLKEFEYECKVLTQGEVGFLIGCLSGMLPVQAGQLNGHIEALEAILDEADQDDMFGTEGWRHRYEGTDPCA